MLPLRAIVDQAAMAMKGWSAFLKAPALLKPHHQIANCHNQDTRLGGILPLFRGAVYWTAPTVYSIADWATLLIVKTVLFKII